MCSETNKSEVIEFAAFDIECFENLEGVNISGCEARRESSPVITPGAPGTPDAGGFRFNGSILKVDDTYMMWYIGYEGRLTGDSIGRVAVAESKDGINWTKPDLGNGSNVVSGIPEQGRCCLSVMRDDDGTFLMAIDNWKLHKKHFSEEHQKLFSDFEPVMPGCEAIARSKDGIHWNYELGDEPIIAEKLEAPRIHKVDDTYIISGQQTYPWYDSDVCRNRVVVFFTSKDLKNWTKVPGFYRNSFEHVPCHIGIAVVEKIGKTLIGLGGRFTESMELPDQHMEVGIVLSQDGINWHEISPETTFIRRGQTGDWDGGAILQANRLINVGDESLIYYNGFDSGNSDNGYSAIGRVRFPLHHYGYMALAVGWNLAGPKSGFADSKSIEVDGSFEVYLHTENIKPGINDIRIQVLDEQGNETSFISDPVESNGFEVPVKWSDEKSLEYHGSMKLRIRFSGGCLRDDSPRLYTFKIIKR